MNVFAYCTFPARTAVETAVGAEPFTSPPHTIQTVGKSFANADFIYFRLHGTPKVRQVWFGETDKGGLVAAFDMSNLVGVTLKRSPVVLIANCFGDQSALVQALYDAGASAVIAGDGPNYAAGKRVIGTDKLASLLLSLLKRGYEIGTAVKLAKARLLLTSWRSADKDAARFRIIANQAKEKMK